MSARPLMVQGTMSGAGKSFLVAGLCRILAEAGYRVAPFKAQNMALNSFVTAEGLEMGRAQVLQAQAARIEPTADMNPILLKPTTDVGSQVIVRGKARGTLSAREYFSKRSALKPLVRESYERLERSFDIIVIEGAGSPVELNLKRDDLCNMGMARMAKSPVILVGDIDPGGVFAQLAGTMMLLEEEERRMVKALVVNKFRGDVTLFADGVGMLQDICGVPVAGVVPFIKVNLEDEDSMALRLNDRSVTEPTVADIAVIRLPRISNFTDFHALGAHPSAHVRYVSGARELGHPDLIILPGTKSTVADLIWLYETGLADVVSQEARSGVPLIGICGGYQMLGTEITDPDGIEGATRSVAGLGLVPITTQIAADKICRQTQGTLLSLPGPLAGLSGLSVKGYEIHQGRSERSSGVPLTRLTSQGETYEDGCATSSVYGTYLHGLFDEPLVVSALIRCLGKQDLQVRDMGMDQLRELEIQKLASGLSSALDMDLILKIIREGL